MDKTKLATPCGLYCGTCSELKKSCKGKPCMEHDGEMFWGKCELFDCCVHKKGLEHCGECSEFPCELFINHNDPSLAPDVAKKENEKRQKELKERKEVGTKKYVKKFE